MSYSENIYNNVWYPEKLFFGTLTYSGLLLTTALLFYHMTKTSSIEMDYRASATFAVGLMLLALLYLITGVTTYYIRLNQISEENLSSDEKKFLGTEKRFFWVYLSGSILFGIIEVMIAIQIIIGVRRNKH